MTTSRSGRALVAAALALAACAMPAQTVGAKAFAVHEVRSLASAVDFWRRHDGCSESARSEVDGSVRRTRHSSCSGGSEVEVVTIDGGGHSWPGGDRLARFLDPASPALDATAEIGRFFARHHR